MMRGIYAITHRSTGRRYVGQSANVETRWRDHRWALRSDRHENRKLQNAWNKYGEDAFRFDLLEETEDLTDREQYHMDRGSHFNIAPAAGSLRGLPLSRSHRAKIGAAHRGRITSQETKDRMSEAHKLRWIKHRDRLLQTNHLHNGGNI